MRKFLLSFVPHPAPSNAFQPWQAAALVVSLGLFAASRLLLILPDALGQAADQLNWEQTPLALANVLFVGVAVLAYVLARRDQWKIGAMLLVGLLLLEGTLYLWGETWDAPRGLAALWTGVALGGLLLARRESAIVTVYGLTAITAGAFREFGDLDSDAQTGRAVVYLALIVWTLALASITVLAGRERPQTRQTTSQHGSARHLIEIGAQVAQGLFSRIEIESFLQQIADTIDQHFESVYHVQIYVVEPGSQQATLRASTGPVGTQLLSQEHELAVGGLSVVGRVTLTGERLLISDISRDPIHKPSDLLARTRSELAIPLTIDEDIVGALDVQSTEPGAFGPTDVELLEATGQQIAVALDGLRLYESAQRHQRENQALRYQTQASLREIERLNYQLTGRAWTDYLRLKADSTAMTLDFETGQTVSEAEWTPTLDEAAANHQVVTTTADGRHIMALPIIVRNEVVGAMEFELEAEDDMPEGAIELITAVGQRLGLALENRRLFDETQRVAQREALINDIGADLQTATGVDAILQRAAHHLQESLNAHQVIVRLGAPNQTDQAAKEKTQV